MDSSNDFNNEDDLISTENSESNVYSEYYAFSKLTSANQRYNQTEEKSTENSWQVAGKNQKNSSKKPQVFSSYIQNSHKDATHKGGYNKNPNYNKLEIYLSHFRNKLHRGLNV